MTVMPCLSPCPEATAQSAEDVAALVLQVEAERQADPTVVSIMGPGQDGGVVAQLEGVPLSFLSPPPSRL